MSTQSSSFYFIVSIQTANGEWKQIGSLIRNKRVEAGELVKQFFPPKTRGYDEVLKTCRYLVAERGAVSVDWQYRNMVLRTAKFSA